MTTNVQLCLIFKQWYEYKQWFEKDKPNKKRQQQQHNAAFQQNKSDSTKKYKMAFVLYQTTFEIRGKP